MAKKSIGKNYIYNLLYEILTVLVPLITTPYISRILGAEGIGIYSFSYSIVTYFLLFSALGSTVYGRREIAYNQDDKQKRSIVFWELCIFRYVMTFICLIIYLIYISTIEYKIVGIIQSIYIISVIFDITWFFQGMEDFKLVVLRNSIIKIINILFIFVFVKTNNDLLVYIFGLAFLPFLGNLITWTCLPKYIEKIKIKDLHPFKHFKGSIALFIPTIASQVYLVLDKTMIGILTDTNVENGFYEQAQKIVKICWTFLTTFAAVMSPRMAYVFARKENDKIKEYLCKSFNIVWIIATPIAFGLASVSTNLVPWFFGDEFGKVSILLIIFCWILFPIGINSVTGSQYLIIAKKHRIYTFSIIFGALVNILLNLFLIPKYYSIGAAIASVIAEIIIAIIQLWYMIYRIKVLNFKDVFNSLWKYLIAGILMFCGVKLVSNFLISNIINTLILISIGAIIYIIVLLILKDQFFIDNVKEIINKIYKKIKKEK